MLPAPHIYGFHTALKNRRIEMGYTKQQLADLAEVDRGSLTHWENPISSNVAKNYISGPRIEKWVSLNIALGYDIPKQHNEVLKKLSLNLLLKLTLIREKLNSSYTNVKDTSNIRFTSVWQPIKIKEKKNVTI